MACKYCKGSHQDQEHYLTKKPYNQGPNGSGMTRGDNGKKAKSEALRKKVHSVHKRATWHGKSSEKLMPADYEKMSPKSYKKILGA